MSRFSSSCLAIVVCSACRIEPSPGAPFQAPDESEEPTPSNPTGWPDATGNAGNDAPPPASGGGAGEGATEPPGGECDAEAVSIDEIREDLVLPGVPIALVATATSQKFLVSQTDAGSCLWGAFVGDEPASEEPRGVLVVSYGNEAPAEARCTAGTDAIPDDLAPGDGVRVVGRAASFAPASCDGIAALPQVIADARCPLERLGRASPPEPFTLPLEVADELARGVDPSLVRRFAGGLVRLEGVSALPNDAGDGAVRPYGVIALAETELEVHGDLEYGDLTEGGPRDAEKGLAFGYPTEFRSITGLLYLDYCTYSLAPRRRCEDFDPKSLDCTEKP
jgi:hypothetical protein